MDTIADKIRKIIAKADSTSHPEEAEAFMKKAQILMMEHGLSLLDLGRLNTDDPVTSDLSCMTINHANDKWRRDLVIALARYYGSRVIYSINGGNSKLSFFGRESANITTSLMYPYVDRQVLHLARQAAADGYYSSPNAARKRIGNALCIRIWEMIEQPEIKAQEGTGSNALVPVDLVRAAIEEVFGKTESRASKLSYDAKGADLAKSVSLNLQATAAPASRRIA